MTADIINIVDTAITNPAANPIVTAESVNMAVVLEDNIEAGVDNPFIVLVKVSRGVVSVSAIVSVVGSVTIVLVVTVDGTFIVVVSLIRGVVSVMVVIPVVGGGSVVETE